VDSRANVLRRYFMLTFTYNLNRAGGPQKRGVPGMPRGMERQMERQMNGGGGASGMPMPAQQGGSRNQ